MLCLRKKIFVPDPSKPPSMWAKQFPSNYMIQGMLEALSTSSPSAGSTGQRSGVARRRFGQTRSVDHGQASALSSQSPNTSSSSTSSSSSRGRPVERMGRSMDSGMRDHAAGSSTEADLESNPQLRAAWRKIEELRASVQAEESGQMALLCQTMDLNRLMMLDYLWVNHLFLN